MDNPAIELTAAWLKGGDFRRDTVELPEPVRATFDEMSASDDSVWLHVGSECFRFGFHQENGKTTPEVRHSVEDSDASALIFTVPLETVYANLARVNG